ncbi:MAG: hypothetical protein LBI19_09820 [Oscillospiraceae bacterium]|jgi:divalent metal cation (Fe/Co/Zn/Cd) transporter|nr:hypothetical protein [Oscillospiraceae bacterium]
MKKVMDTVATFIFVLLACIAAIVLLVVFPGLWPLILGVIGAIIAYRALRGLIKEAVKIALEESHELLESTVETAMKNAILATKDNSGKKSQQAKPPGYINQQPNGLEGTGWDE